MRLTDKALSRLVVKTVSGTVLGRIRGFEIDIDEHSITHYLVISSLLRSRKYLVSRAQVRQITHTEMIVDDSVVRQGKSRRRLMIKPNSSPSLGAVTNDSVT